MLAAGNRTGRENQIDASKVRPTSEEEIVQSFSVGWIGRIGNPRFKSPGSPSIHSFGPVPRDSTAVVLREAKLQFRIMEPLEMLIVRSASQNKIANSAATNAKPTRGPSASVQITRARIDEEHGTSE